MTVYPSDSPLFLSSTSSSLICCRPPSVLPYQSFSCYISLHLSRSSSFSLPHSHFCLYLPIAPQSVSALFNQKLFQPVSKYNVTPCHTHTHTHAHTRLHSHCKKLGIDGEFNQKGKKSYTVVHALCTSNMRVTLLTKARRLSKS